MKKRKYCSFKCIYLLMLLSFSIFLITAWSEKVLGDSPELIEREAHPGDFVFCDTPEAWWYEEMPPLIDWFVENFCYSIHTALYYDDTCFRSIFIEAGPGPVHKISYDGLQFFWNNIDCYYVCNYTIDDPDRDFAAAFAKENLGRLYQWIEPLKYNHFDPEDPLDVTGLPWLLEWKLKNMRIPKFQCAELIWAGYMTATNAEVNIAEDSFYQPEFGYSCYNNVGAFNLIDEDVEENENTDPFINTKPFKSIYDLEIDGIVDATRENDDPENRIWTTINKGIKNCRRSGVLLVKNGNYEENLFVNKSINIIGENVNKVILNGSITLKTSNDYELPNQGRIDPLTNVNMLKNQVLFHFNNDSSKGENYSSSNIIYDYSGLGNNATKNFASWTTNTLKGEGALIFNGENSTVNLSSISALVNENITISSWINWTEGTGENDVIISQSNITNGYCLYINCTTEKPIFSLDNIFAISSINITPGWHNIVGSHNETTLKIYIDGILRNSTLKSGNGSNLDAFIGYDNQSGYFNGTIDEIAIWNRTLSEKEISHICNLNQGVIMKNMTIKDGNIGLTLCNRSEIYNCNIVNHSLGIKVENMNQSWVLCNITDCTTGVQVINSTPGTDDQIWFGLCNISNCTDGMIINSSTNISVTWTIFNTTDDSIRINDCKDSDVAVQASISVDNVDPTIENYNGSELGDPGVSYSYSSTSWDSNGDQIFYMYDWGDGNCSGWLGPYESNETVNDSHIWSDQGGYFVRVKTKDIFGNETGWSEILFRTESLSPIINSMIKAPDIIDVGSNYTFSTNVTENTSGNYSGIKNVYVNITYPNNSMASYVMTNVVNDTYEYNFNNTWTQGVYNYTIYAIDNAYNSVVYAIHSLNVSIQGDMTVCTIKDEYGENETINLTDPPSPLSEDSLIGYELLDDNKVLHIWNKYNSYYFNTSSGIQLTNHKDEFWTQNVLMLGYQNNESWNLIYRTDELSGFTKNITTDNETFVNATLWKNLNYQGYDFRLAIRYYLGVNDVDLTVIPYIKNIDNEEIPYVLGFGWEMKDIRIANVTSDIYLYIYNGTGFEDILLNQTLDKSFNSMGNGTVIRLVCKDPPTQHLSRDLYLSWDKNLTYMVTVKSRTGQYNAPVTLFIRIGNLSIGQSKSTQMHWLDSDDWLGVSSDEYDSHCGDTNGRTLEEALDGTDYWYHQTNHDHYFVLDLGQSYDIEKFRSRSIRGSDPTDVDIYVSDNKSNWGSAVVTGISSWQDTSNWQEVSLSKNASGRYIKVEVQSTEHFLRFIEWGGSMGPPYITIFDVFGDNAPDVSNPYPNNGSYDISISPTLNITISDPDGDLMNITWFSNSSGKWEIFGTNSSVSNGTYHQVFSNASVNGQWWYWYVNVTDISGNSFVSDTYKFYTGNQSKIKNTGSYDINGYLLIQVHYYNTSTSNWTLADDTINETTMRTIESCEQFGLDTVFNGNVNTTELLNSFGNGTYRVYAAFRDPDGDALVCDDETLLETSYEFTITSS